jgi:pimeloyl-ACP methyl ester carboxylesterase
MPVITATVLWDKIRGIATCLLVAVFLAGCTPAPLIKYSTETPPLVLVPASAVGVTDQRGRFREIFCAATDAHGKQFEDHRPCDEALVRLNGEPETTGRPVYLGSARSRLKFAMVPGLGWSCFKDFILPSEVSAIDHIESLGYQFTTIDVDPLSSSTRNASQIRDAVLDMTDVQGGEKLVLIGYSKGTPDILEALVLYPEIVDRVAAVVSIAGAVGGSPLADGASDSVLDTLGSLLGEDCPVGDGGAIESLRTSARMDWLAQHKLPDAVKYYSLITFPDRDHVSSGLISSYDKLSQIDPRNDTQVIFYDQMIPGSTLLGYLQADHWAVMLPIDRSHETIAKTFFDQNDFPREILFESFMRYIEEDLMQADQ